MKFQTIVFSLLLLLHDKSCKDVSLNDGTSVEAATEASSVQTVKDTTTHKTHFGVMVAKSNGQNISPEKQADVVKQLGARYTRGRIDIKTWNGSNEAYDAYAAAGLKVLLNLNYGVPRNASGEHDPIPFPTDMTWYSKVLNSVLNKYKPEVVVIENEEDNPMYHSGDADDYINMLKTAIPIVHSKGLKVTNGGITVKEICLIIYDDYVQRGEKDKALEFAKKAFPPQFLHRVSINEPKIQQLIVFGRKIMAAYKTLDLDYVNFHWYEPVRGRGKNGDAAAKFDPKILEFVVNYLRTQTNKPVLSNEFGVLDPSPELVKSLLQGVRDAGMSYAIFYSSDGEGLGKAIGLQNAGGDLRENGAAFRDFMKQHNDDSND
jgi:hypothetical protein